MTAPPEPSEPTAGEPSTTGEPTLVLVGTPIGNLGDASERMRTEIAHAHVIAAEDTRRFMGLATRLGVTYTGKVMSLFDHNEHAKSADIATLIERGNRVVLLTDAGMPAVSDPGYHVVIECLRRGLQVTAVPGPSAVLTALALAGLPTDRFTFEGFVPRKTGERARLLESLAGEERTMVFFESPHRIVTTLEAFAEHFGATRRMALCRELTKVYEETLRGTVGDIRAEVEARASIKGELTLVVEGTAGGETPWAKEKTHQVTDLVGAGLRAKDAAALVASWHGLKSRELYEEYLRAK